jgi:hypothetical protein
MSNWNPADNLFIVATERILQWEQNSRKLMISLPLLVTVFTAFSPSAKKKSIFLNKIPNRCFFNNYKLWEA